MKIVAEDHVVGAHLRARFGECAPQINVTRIDPAQNIAAGAFEPLGDSLRISAIGLADPAGDPILILADDVDAAVGGAAVDNEVLVAGREIVEHGDNRLFKIGRHVERRRDDGDAHLLLQRPRPEDGLAHPATRE